MIDRIEWQNQINNYSSATFASANSFCSPDRFISLRRVKQINDVSEESWKERKETDNLRS